MYMQSIYLRRKSNSI